MKEVKILGTKATLGQLWTALWQNFLYGFLAGALPTAVSLRNDSAVFISCICFYSVLSIVLNREPYKTRLGRFIIFPISAASGFFISYKIITTLV